MNNIIILNNKLNYKKYYSLLYKIYVYKNLIREMPKPDKDLNNSFVYQLKCKNQNIIRTYVGSTIHYKSRELQHIESATLGIDKSYKYKFINNSGRIENWYMVIIEQCSFNSRRELEKQERFHMDRLNATLNSKRPYLYENEKKRKKQKKPLKRFKFNNNILIKIC